MNTNERENLLAKIIADVRLLEAESPEAKEKLNTARKTLESITLYSTDL